MKNVMVRNLVLPLVERLGTMVAAYIIATGADSGLAAQVANGLVACMFILIDLVTSKIIHREAD